MIIIECPDCGKEIELIEHSEGLAWVCCDRATRIVCDRHASVPVNGG